MFKQLIIAGVFFLMVQVSFADDYYAQHATGWHWYDDPKQDVPVKKQEEIINKNDPNVVVETARKKITTALNQVIADPTIEHLETYIALQEQLSNRAEKVADLWEQALLKSPALNYALTDLDTIL